MPSVENETQDATIAIDDLADKPLTKADLMGILKDTLPQMVTGAVTGHLKRAQNKVPKLVAETTEVEEETPSPAVPRSKSKGTEEAMSRRLTELENQLKAANEEKRQSSVQNRLTGMVKGKVSQDWQDVAIQQMASRIKYNDDSPEFIVNDVAYTLEDGVQEWLKDPSNKRFLEAPKARVISQEKRPVVAAVVAGSNNGTQVPIKSIDQLARELQAEWANRQ